MTLDIGQNRFNSFTIIIITFFSGCVWELSESLVNSVVSRTFYFDLPFTLLTFLR